MLSSLENKTLENSIFWSEYRKRIFEEWKVVPLYQIICTWLVSGIQGSICYPPRGPCVVTAKIWNNNLLLVHEIGTTICKKPPDIIDRKFWELFACDISLLKPISWMHTLHSDHLKSKMFSWNLLSHRRSHLWSSLSQLHATRIQNMQLVYHCGVWYHQDRAIYT